VDSWVPRRFAALSERLSMQNGVLLMGVAALVALLATRGDVRYLVVMYSINVFLTFTMTELSMCRLWLSERRSPGGRPDWWKKIAIHVIGFTMCATILAITVVEKFAEGGWITLLITAAVIALCILVRRHYRATSDHFARAFAGLEAADRTDAPPLGEPDPAGPVAVVLVGGYTGFGVHTTLNVFRAFPGHFRGVVFASVGVLDSGAFKGEDAVAELRAASNADLARYSALAARLGLPCAVRLAIGTDAVEQAETLCRAIATEFPRPTFFAGQVIFKREAWYHRLLHNQTAYAIQRRLQWAGLNAVILPARVAPV
jgi:hypothetical protein